LDNPERAQAERAPNALRSFLRKQESIWRPEHEPTSTTLAVMAALDAAIHAMTVQKNRRGNRPSANGIDRPVKPGDDGGEMRSDEGKSLPD
jgi:hypothetical protein